MFVLLHYLIMLLIPLFLIHDTASSDIYTLSLHDALPILEAARGHFFTGNQFVAYGYRIQTLPHGFIQRLGAVQALNEGRTKTVRIGDALIGDTRRGNAKREEPALASEHPEDYGQKTGHGAALVH